MIQERIEFSVGIDILKVMVVERIGDDETAEEQRKREECEQIKKATYRPPDPENVPWWARSKITVSNHADRALGNRHGND